jgi:steroid delta-isomerase-like uncharacterized protein
MSDNRVERVARRFIEAWGVDGLRIIDDLAAPDLVVSYSHFPEPIRGAEAFKEALARTYEYFPDIEITADEVIATEDRAVVRWRYRGTHRAGEMFGLTATGKRVEVPGITLYRVANGRVTEESGVVDTFALMLQLGAVPSPRGSE